MVTVLRLPDRPSGEYLYGTCVRHRVIVLSSRRLATTSHSAMLAEVTAIPASARLRRTRLYMISDRRLLAGRSMVDAVSAVLDAVPTGSAALQLREKDLSDAELGELVRALLPVTRRRDCPLLINGRVKLALACGADGVHLPDHGAAVAEVRAAIGRARAIGASSHSPKSAQRHARAGADLVVCGPIWATPSKASYGAPLGVDALARAARRVAGSPAALLAIGGIDGPQRARAAIEHGARGVAAIRAFFGGSDPARTASAMAHAIGLVP
ncbi:MAG: thiamine phosphate synthase [Myxococcota bacterium]